MHHSLAWTSRWNRAWWIAIGVLVAACGNGNMTADGSGSDIASSDQVTTDAGSDIVSVDSRTDAGPVTDGAAESAVDAPPDVPFMPGMHDPFPQVTNLGGPVHASNPRIVAITYADDPNRAQIEAYIQWLVSSSWIPAVGAEYGVQSASILGMNELTINAPPGTISDNDVANMIANGIMNGTLATPMDGDFSNVIYMAFYPVNTTIDVYDQTGTVVTTQSCVSAGGWHSEYPGTYAQLMSPDGGVSQLQFTYAVIPFCPNFAPGLTDVQGQQIAVSHEFIEAATDPLPFTNPAFTLYDPNLQNLPAWVLVGGELADLCELDSQYYMSNNYVAQRVWSNAAALAHPNSDPCVPSVAGETYFNTSVSPGDIQYVLTDQSTMVTTAAQTVMFTVEGFSDGPTGRWNIFAQPTGPLMPTLSWTQNTISNGQSVTLQVTVPAGTPSGSETAIVVYSYDGATQTEHAWPAGLYVY